MIIQFSSSNQIYTLSKIKKKVVRKLFKIKVNSSQNTIKCKKTIKIWITFMYIKQSCKYIQIFYPSQALKFGFAIKKNHIQATPNISLLLKTKWSRIQLWIQG